MVIEKVRYQKDKPVVRLRVSKTGMPLRTGITSASMRKTWKSFLRAALCARPHWLQGSDWRRTGEIGVLRDVIQNTRRAS